MITHYQLWSTKCQHKAQYEKDTKKNNITKKNFNIKGNSCNFNFFEIGEKTSERKHEKIGSATESLKQWFHVGKIDQKSTKNTQPNQ